MKKIYGFVALLFTCFTANAQSNWSKGEENVKEDGIKENKFYVLCGGDNTKLNDNGQPVDGKDAANLGLWITSGQKNKAVDISDECVFQFEKTGATHNGYPVYALKNFANKQYLSGNFAYDPVRARAFQFTIRNAESTTEPEGNAPINESDWEWDQYSNAVSDSRSILAADNGALVLCLIDRKAYLTYGANPDVHGWIDTNNWMVYEVTAEEMPAYQKLYQLWDRNFPDGKDGYTIGVDPGCVSPEFYARLSEMESKIMDVTPDTPAEQCESLITELNDLVASLPTALVTVAPGKYFVIKNVNNRGFLTVTADGKKGRGNSALATEDVKEDTDYANWTPASMASWDLESAKFIWEIEAAKEDGKILFKNFGTGKYLSTSNDYAMVEQEGAAPFVAKMRENQEFNLLYGNNSPLHMKNNGDHLLMTYNANDPGSIYRIYTIDTKVTDSLKNKVSQQVVNDKLQALVKRAKSDLLGLKYKNGFVDGPEYNAPADSGLTKVVTGNATDRSNLPAKLFDGNKETFYHTVSSADVPGNHWIQMDMGKEVQNVRIKFSKREGVYNNHVSQFELQAADDPTDLENTTWTKVAESNFKDSIEYTYAPETDTNIHKFHKYMKPGTFIGTFKLDKKAQHLRFVVKSTWGRDKGANTVKNESGPIWHMAEFRIYDEDETVANPRFDEVPENITKELNAAIEQAETELKAGTGLETTYKTLDKALDAFWKAYPDESALKEALEAAFGMAERATEYEGDTPEMGFFAPGAIKEFLDAVKKIGEEVKAFETSNKAMSLEQIKTFEKQLDDATAKFNAKLVVPKGGKVYRIKSTAGYELTADGEIKVDAEGNLVMKAQDGAYIASVNADHYNGSPVWRYGTNANEENLNNRFNTLWLVETNEEGKYAFKNLVNGLYIDNVYEGLTPEAIEELELKNNQLGYSLKPKYFSLESYTAEKAQSKGSFVVALMKGQYMNFQGAGEVMVHYEDRDDAHAPLTFEEVTELEGESYYVNVQPGKWQILSFPFDIKELYGSVDEMYFTVKGKMDGKIWLEDITNTEIKAGHPFIIKTGADVNFIELVLSNADDLETLQGIEHSYDRTEDKGLVAAPFGFRVEAGEAYGVLLGESVVPAATGENIAAGTGFFNTNIPEITETTDVFFNIEGAITGEGTAVENVELVKNTTTDVYTISGVKVRHNVKLDVATKGLPKGIYIVGGQKVIVK